MYIYRQASQVSACLCVCVCVYAWRESFLTDVHGTLIENLSIQSRYIKWVGYTVGHVDKLFPYYSLCYIYIE